LEERYDRDEDLGQASGCGDGCLPDGDDGGLRTGCGCEADAELDLCDGAEEEAGDEEQGGVCWGFLWCVLGEDGKQLD
jgi:hypothetical protein